MQKIYLIQTSVASLVEAKELCDGLLQGQLCACAQISAAGLSIYHWQGSIEQAEEYYLTIKTNQRNKDRVVIWLQEHHTYDLPEISWAVHASTEKYARWVTQQLRK